MKTIYWNTLKQQSDGLLPAIVQDQLSGKVLMLGYMNEEALRLSQERKKVYFYSRSKERLWMKGEQSGNTLTLMDIKVDCDCDALLVQVRPAGPVCHQGTDTCWREENRAFFLKELEEKIHARKSADPAHSYTAQLFEKGINKIGQKLGEEAVEMLIDGINGKREDFIAEAADLMYHYMVMLAAKEVSLEELMDALKTRSN